MTNHKLSAFTFAILAAASSILTGCGKQVEPADLVIRGGRIVTMDSDLPIAEALAVRGDTVVAVGSNDDINDYVGSSTKILELGGACAVPGFIEGHGHFLGVGYSKMGLDLLNTKSWNEIVQMVREAAKETPKGEWIVGRGWHQEKWDATPVPNYKGFPVHTLLSNASPNNPVILTHASGHASIANAKAMELAKVTSATRNPEGGEILKDAKGNPTGVFIETAQRLIGSARARWQAKRSAAERDADLRKAARLAAEECLSKGVTSFHDAGVPFSTVNFYRKLVDEKSLGVRLWVMVRDSVEALAKDFPAARIVDYGDRRLTVRAIKWSIDGALGPRGAWLLEPYSDLPSSTGLNTASIEDIKRSGEIAATYDLQLCVHAIGDRANRETLDIYEKVFRLYPGKKDLRWRIEHAQHLSASDIPRFGQLGVIAAMQGIHCTSDAPYVITRLGEKRAEEGAYVWQKLLQSGAVIVNGTDAPVERVDPIQSFYASVTRKLDDGTVFYANQRMSREEALTSYTIGAAYGAFEEKTKGSLSPGKLADITVLSKDIMTVPDDEIRETEILFTIVGGKVMYEKSSAGKENR